MVESGARTPKPDNVRRSRATRLVTSLAGSVVLAGLAGAALALAFPPYNAWIIAPAAVGALLLVIRAATQHLGTRRCLAVGALTGAAFGLAFFGLLTPWLLVIGPDAYVLVVAMSMAFTALFGAGAGFILRLPGWPIWISCWWVAIEALRDRVPFGGFPWGRIGHSQVDAPSAAWVSVGGVPLLGFVVVLAGALWAWAVVAAITHRRVAAAVALASGLVVVLASGAVLPTPTDGRDLSPWPWCQGIVQTPAWTLGLAGRSSTPIWKPRMVSPRRCVPVRWTPLTSVIWPRTRSVVDP